MEVHVHVYLQAIVWCVVCVCVCVVLFQAHTIPLTFQGVAGKASFTTFLYTCIYSSVVPYQVVYVL